MEAAAATLFEGCTIPCAAPGSGFLSPPSLEPSCWMVLQAALPDPALPAWQARAPSEPSLPVCGARAARRHHLP